VLGVVGISLFGTGVLTYLPMSNGASPLTLVVLLLTLVSGIWNDNHAVRVGDGPDIAVQRPTSVEQLAAWQQGRAGNAVAPESVILVATSGGGISAAYWTASTLAYLEQKFGAPFTERLFAVSGVSGGSLGAATYVALKRAGLETGQADALLDQVREVHGQDFLSPVVAGMLFPDLVQRFLPVPIGLADRQRFLERSWEAAFDGEARALFKDPFQGFYSGPEAAALPSLLLNTTIVETGQRGVFSNLRVDGPPQVIDLLEPRYGLGGVRTNAAAGGSARFTNVSPAGTVHFEDSDTLRLVDGGYFENSGAASMTDLITLLVTKGAALNSILIIIDNETTAPNLCRRDGIVDQAPSGEGFNSTVSEVTAPAQAFLQTRAARGKLAEVTAANLVEGIGGTVIEVPLASVLRARLAAMRAADAETIRAVKKRYVAPPLGWSWRKRSERAWTTPWATSRAVWTVSSGISPSPSVWSRARFRPALRIRGRVFRRGSEELHECGDGGHLGEHQRYQPFEQIQLNVCDLFLQPQLGRMQVGTDLLDVGLELGTEMLDVDLQLGANLFDLTVQPKLGGAQLGSDLLDVFLQPQLGLADMALGG
jgi:hypothetical protein